MSVFLAIALMTLLGWFLGGAVEPGLPRLARCGNAFPIGAGVAALSLGILSILRIRWSAVPLGVLVALIAGVSYHWRHRHPVSPRRLEQTPGASRWAIPIDALTIAVLAGYAKYATIAPPWEWDFWSIWGLKGRLFWAAHSIDWKFLLDREHDFAHLDYPLLLPLTFDVTAVVGGGWNDRWLGFLYVAFACSTLLVIRGLTEEEHGPIAGAVTTLAVTGCCCSGWVGLGEGPMLAYSSCALLLIRRSLRLNDRISPLGAVLLSFAALTKNEGLSLLIATLIGVTLSSKTRIRESALLVPIAITTALLLVRRLLHLQASDFHLAGLRNTMADLPGFLRTMTSVNPPHPILWIMFGSALVIGGAAFFERERLLITTIVLHLLACIAAYSLSALELGWHVRNSWPRVSSQIEPLIGFVVASFLLRYFPGQRSGPSGESESSIDVVFRGTCVAPDS